MWQRNKNSYKTMYNINGLHDYLNEELEIVVETESEDKE